MRTFVLCLLLASGLSAGEPPLVTGDRVVFLGSTMVEREQRYGWWETALTARFASATVVFRNLGWSGDTVFGEARAGFGSPADGFKQLRDLTLELKPTRIVICYGLNESFAGKNGLERFRKQYEVLLDALAPAKARIALMTPTGFEVHPQRLPDPTANNANLALYVEVVREIAKKRDLGLIDLWSVWKAEKPANASWTDNGMHMVSEGYLATAPMLLKAAGWDVPAAISLTAIPMQTLRETIRDKNELYFHRWRPQNQTYLFGFRKHEQGRNAKEIVEFDPLVAKKEAVIREMVEGIGEKK